MIIRLPFGQGAVPVDLRGFRIRPLAPEGRRGRPDPAKMVLDAAARPLLGPSLRERAQALIDIAHPEDRAGLVQEAKDKNEVPEVVRTQAT